MKELNPINPLAKKRGNPGWVKGTSSPNPSGRPGLSPVVREALRADTIELYEKAKQLARDAEQAGDLKTASAIVLALLRKTIPDAVTLDVAVESEGLTVTKIDPSKLTLSQLTVLKELLALQRT